MTEQQGTTGAVDVDRAFDKAYFQLEGVRIKELGSLGKPISYVDQPVEYRPLGRKACQRVVAEVCAERDAEIERLKTKLKFKVNDWVKTATKFGGSELAGALMRANSDADEAEAENKRLQAELAKMRKGPSDEEIEAATKIAYGQAVYLRRDSASPPMMQLIELTAKFTVREILKEAPDG